MWGFHKQFQLYGSTDIHKPSHNTDRTVNVSFHIGSYISVNDAVSFHIGI